MHARGKDKLALQKPHELHWVGAPGDAHRTWASQVISGS